MNESQKQNGQNKHDGEHNQGGQMRRDLRTEKQYLGISCGIEEVDNDEHDKRRNNGLK